MNWNKKASIIIVGIFCFSIGLAYIEEQFGYYRWGSIGFVLVFFSIVLFAISVLLSAIHLAQSLFEWFIEKRPKSILWNLLAAVPIFYVFGYLFLNSGIGKNLMYTIGLR